MDNNFSDKPISSPGDDRFGFDDFAKIVASSIASLTSSEGTVLAINGPWGSGKSSVVNLVKHHLTALPGEQALEVVDFQCWWFKGEEALAVAFFQHLYKKVGASLGTRFKKVARKFGSKVVSAGSVAASGADVAGGAGAIGAVFGRLADFMPSSQSVEDLHDEMAELLRKQDKRFLIVIDDIDRLSPDEAIQMFRLVKSVGRLPNVIYLLVYDRALAAATLARAFPTEGPGYLEKIVQGSYDVPELSASELGQQLLADVGEITEQYDKIDTVEFMNIFYDVVTPLIRFPRHLTSLSNTLVLRWNTVGHEVFLADFLAIEAIRLFQFDLYNALRRNKDMLCPSTRFGDRYDMSAIKARYDTVFLEKFSEAEREGWINRLCRIFPRLKEVWRNNYMGGDIESRWNVDRRICSSKHFDTYFGLSLGADVLGQSEIDQMLEGIEISGDLEQRLRSALSTVRTNGMTKASLILDILTENASRISLERATIVLSTVFRMADELDVEADKAKGFSIGSNNLRIHWLLRRLLLERTELDQRSAILMKAAENAAIGWLVDLYWSAFHDYHPREGKQPESEDNCLLTQEAVERLKQDVIDRLEVTSKGNELIDNPALVQLLYSWNDLNDDNGSTVRGWTTKQLSADGNVVKFAKAFTSHGWSQGMGFGGDGDLVAKRTTTVRPSSMADFFDLDVLRKRAEEIADKADVAAADISAMKLFLEAWDRATQGDID